MKKFLALICVLAIALCFAGCSGSDQSADTASAGDTSSVSVDVNAPDAQSVIDYFKAAGLFTEDGGMEIWTQDHATYWPATPVSECVGWWHPEDDTKPCVMILLLDDSQADSSAEEYDSWISCIKENHALTDEFGALGIDHLVGNMAFSYSEMTLDDDDLAAIEAVFEQFVADTGSTPEF